MNRRSILGLMAAMIALPLTAIGSSIRSLKTIRITDFSDSSVELTFPDEGTRQTFWQVFTGVFWPEEHRTGSRKKAYDNYYGPILRGTGQHGGLTANLGRPSYFNKYQLEAAAILYYDHGIVLECLRDDNDKSFKMTRIVTPKFSQKTVSKAAI